jgi:predicted transcriptional regulator
VSRFPNRLLSEPRSSRYRLPRPLCSTSYTLGIKTAISIPDELFNRADALAARLGKSRSQLYREALAEYLARREPDAVTATLDTLVDELGDGRDEWSSLAGQSALERVEW